MEALKLHDAVVFLAAAGLVIPVAKHFKINPVLGFMLIGLFVGPFGIARVTDQAPWVRYLAISDVSGVTTLAELGVIFLLFMIGLELSLERLWAMRRLVFGMGMAQVVITSAIISVVAFLFGNTGAASIVLGSCLALSSTAVVIQLLMEQGRFGSPVGRGSFAILLAQDIAVIPILFIVSTLSTLGTTSVVGALATAFAQALLAVAIILGIGRLIVRPVFRFVGNTQSPELFLAATLLAIIATAATTHLAGLSGALGAFLAGLLLAETEFRYEIETNIDPFKGLLIGLFFMSVAMSIDLALVAANIGWVAISVIGLFSMKAIIMTIITRLFGFSLGQAVEVGLFLGQGGEFAFVVVGIALSHTLLPAETAQFMLVVVGATMFLTPFISRLAMRIHRALDANDVTAPPTQAFEGFASQELTDHVIIVGFGRTGQLLAALLDRQQAPYIALDLDISRVQGFQAQGAPVYRGDATRAQLLKKMGINSASALAVCTDDTGVSEQIVASARKLSDSIPIIVRARDEKRALELLSAGATQVIPEVFESGLQFGHLLLEQLGVPNTAARDLVDSLRTDTIHGMHTKR